MSICNKIDYRVHLSYRDVLLVPFDDSYCTIESRNDPDISTSVGGFRIKTPIISSPMDSVTGPDMVRALHDCGALGILTRYINQKNELERQVSDLKQINNCNPLACAIGVKHSVEGRVKTLYDHGVRIFCLDIANGNHLFMLNALKEINHIKDCLPGIRVIAGNVATGKAAVRLAENGADTIKVGIGPGGACTTRRVTGFGVPQFEAIMDCYHSLNMEGHSRVSIIADGGIRHSGDAVKALWAGADAIMSGYVISGHDECPKIDGKRVYRGMSSRNVSNRSDIAEEGICFDIESRGPVAKTINEWSAGIKAGLSMGNASNIKELRKKVKAIRVSTMSNQESDPVRGE